MSVSYARRERAERPKFVLAVSRRPHEAITPSSKGRKGEKKEGDRRGDVR